jgi:hypothetical protein
MHQHNIYGKHKHDALPATWIRTDPSLKTFQLVGRMSERGLIEDLERQEGDNSGQRVMIGLLKKLRKNIKAASFTAMTERSRAMFEKVTSRSDQLGSKDMVVELDHDAKQLVAAIAMYNATRSPLFGGDGLATISKAECMEAVMAMFASIAFRGIEVGSMRAKAVLDVTERDFGSETTFLAAFTALQMTASLNTVMAGQTSILLSTVKHAIETSVNAYREQEEGDLIQALYDEGPEDPISIFNPMCSLEDGPSDGNLWCPLFSGRVGSVAARQILGTVSGLMACVAPEKEDGSIGTANAETVARLRGAAAVYPMSMLTTHLISTRADSPVTSVSTLFSSNMLISRAGLASVSPDGAGGFLIDKTPEPLEEHRSDLDSVEFDTSREGGKDSMNKIVVPSPGMTGLSYALLYLGMVYGTIFDRDRIVGSEVLTEIGDTTTSCGGSRIIDDALCVANMAQTRIVDEFNAI